MANVASCHFRVVLATTTLLFGVALGCGTESSSPNASAGGTSQANNGAAGASEPSSASQASADSVCGKFATQLKTCALVPSTADFGCGEPQTDQSRCERACVLSANCTELTVALCQSAVDAPELMACLNACATQFAVDCGNGETYQPSGRCNGTPSCTNGADESGCGDFACKSGEAIALNLKCNQHRDCPDGSDEVGCGVFVCADNVNYIASTYQCDGSLDCQDGSDEIGCPTTTCASGSVIFAYKRCDGTEDCLDKSDETGCLAVLADVLACPEPVPATP